MMWWLLVCMNMSIRRNKNFCIRYIWNVIYFHVKYIVWVDTGRTVLRKIAKWKWKLNSKIKGSNSSFLIFFCVRLKWATPCYLHPLFSCYFFIAISAFYYSDFIHPFLLALFLLQFRIKFFDHLFLISFSCL